MTKSEYAEYQKAVAHFFEREGLANLSSMSSESYFSWRPCQCCGTGLGGDREDANGYNPTTHEVQSYEFICLDCIYHAEYGRLDDTTMLEIENDRGELMARTYENGRPTTGWRKGKRITSPEQVKPGDVLTGVNHQFRAENLYLVIPSPYPPTPHDDQGFHVRFAQPDLSPEFPDFQPQWVWDFMLAGSSEWFNGIRREKRTAR